MDIDTSVTSKFSKRIQRCITYAEKDSYKHYHIVIFSPVFGSASFHESSISELKWQINDFLEKGVRY